MGIVLSRCKEFYLSANLLQDYNSVSALSPANQVKLISASPDCHPSGFTKNTNTFTINGVSVVAYPIGTLIQNFDQSVEGEPIRNDGLGTEMQVNSEGKKSATCDMTFIVDDGDTKTLGLLFKSKGGLRFIYYVDHAGNAFAFLGIVTTRSQSFDNDSNRSADLSLVNAGYKEPIWKDAVSGI